MNPTVLHISTADAEVLRLLIARGADPTGRLRTELDRALVLDATALPAGTIGLNSRVRLRDLDSGETEEYVLSLPAQADPERQRLSVLAPVGTALLGYHVGDEIEWLTPGGRRRLKVLEVTPEPPVATSLLERLRS